MNNKYSGLRFGRLKLTATAMAVGGVSVLQAGTAHAVPATGTGTGVFTINAGTAIWYLNNNITFTTTSNNWGFSEASLMTGVGTRGDAYDGALGWLLSTGVPTNLDGYKSPGGTIDISPTFPTNPAVGTTATGTTQAMSGLNVSGQMYFSPVKPVVRSILVMQNPTGAPITVTVGNMSNLGSDNNTTLQLTSSGDAVFDPTDNWVVSSETPAPGPGNDPILTFAFQGAGAAVRGTPNPPIVTGDDSFYNFYTLTIPAGQTRRLMVFSQLSDTVANAEADAAVFNSAAALSATDYLSGLSSADLASIVNWSGLTAGAGGAGIGSNGIPTTSNWVLAALASLMGVFGLGALKRRRQQA